MYIIIQTASVRGFSAAAARTYFDSVRRTHTYTSFCARTRIRIRTFFQKKPSNICLLNLY